jgi:hypothetical protein
MFLFCLGCSQQKEFNSEEWKNWIESEANTNTRWLMHDDLLNKHDLRNFDKEKIIDLLGEPDSDKNNEYQYFLGDTGQGINTGTLIIKFVDNSVAEVKIIQG